MSALRILSAGAVKRGVSQMAEAFARERGTQVEIDFDTAPELRKRMMAGGEADVLVAPPSVMDELTKAGRIVPDSRRFIGRSRIGVVVHAASPIGEIPDVESLKRALGSASVVVRNTASTGIYGAKLLQDLGFGGKAGPRTVVVERGAAIMEYVAVHPGSVGLAAISEIRVLISKGLPIRMAGPLPDTVQNVTGYEAAAIAGGTQESSARALADFMATPEAKKIFAATGID